jgi:hypothetical protein
MGNGGQVAEKKKCHAYHPRKHPRLGVIETNHTISMWHTKKCHFYHKSVYGIGFTLLQQSWKTIPRWFFQRLHQ